MNFMLIVCIFHVNNISLCIADDCVVLILLYSADYCVMQYPIVLNINSVFKNKAPNVFIDFF